MFMPLVSIALLTLLSGCGKYLPPLAPEDLAPARAGAVAVSTSTDGVKFSWSAPSLDSRGKELRSIDGYKIVRKVIVKDSDLVNDDIQFESIGTVADQHLIELDTRRAEAREAGKPTRRLAPKTELTHFEFVDSSVVAGQRYAYRIVPTNQGGTEGDRGDTMVVNFRGESSEVRVVPGADLADLAL